MKASYLLKLLIAAVVVVGCSHNDDSLPKQEQAQSLPLSRFTNTKTATLRTYYATSIAGTTAHNNLRAASQAFALKLNGRTPSFSTKTQWMNYVSTNFSSLSFTSMSQANTMFDAVTTASTALMTLHHSNFYNQLGDGDHDQLQLILQQPVRGMLPAEPVAMSCDEVYDGLIGCAEAVDTVANMILVQYPLVYITSGPVAAAELMAGYSLTIAAGYLGCSVYYSPLLIACAA